MATRLRLAATMAASLSTLRSEAPDMPVVRAAISGSDTSGASGLFRACT
jgi:hypothetical protein